MEKITALWFRIRHKSAQCVTEFDKQICILCCQGLFLSSLGYCVASHELQMALLTTTPLELNGQYRCAPSAYQMLEACNREFDL